MSKKVISSTTTVNLPILNPWTNIGWNLGRIASIDNSYLASWPNSKYIQTTTLPEPYTGDVNSGVYCLNLNPGDACICDSSDPGLKKDFENYTQQTLCHSIKGNMWLLPFFQGTAGYTWWQLITNWLRGWLQKNKNGQNPRMFVIEYFPYHTVKETYFPRKLPSYEYSNQLIRQAMAENKYIVIMRHRKEWLQRISGLEEYERLAYLNNPRRPYLTKNNFKHGGPRANFDFEELQKQF